MSPKGSSSSTRSASSNAAPYARRAAGQPKSSRQQFSAVRCDLKDLPVSPSGQQSSCSNCRERGIKCVDEFAEVKAVKLLRRGRRLQKAEAVYGKVTSDDSAASSSANPATVNTATPLSPISPISTQQTNIPQLKLEFLSSPFFRRFSVQRPIIEPTEFTARYFAHVKGSTSLGIEGQILAMLLVTWAASFGVNEYGVEEDEPLSPTSSVGSDTSSEDAQETDPRRRMRKIRAEAMAKEILGLIDAHGLMRHGTWDGVRVLLLILPLTQGIQAPMDRLTMYEATLSQIYSLCSLANPSTVNSGQGPYCDALVRARIFWYAHTHEGVTTGLRGGRLLLDDDDLIAFRSTLPPQYCSSASASSSISAPPSSMPSPTSPVSAEFSLSSFQDPRGHSRASLAYLLTTHYFSLALSVSAICRRIHAILTGTRARRRAEAGVGVDEESLVEVWDELERCWDQFEALRRGAGGIGGMGGGLIRGEDVERFVSGWQVFIFECHNVIREALKQHIITQSPHGSPTLDATSGPIHPSTTAQRYSSALRLHAYATRRCRKVLPGVLGILKRHLAVSSSGFFAWDAGLVRDGCFFAGLLLAQGELEMEDIEVDIKEEEGMSWDVDVEEGVEVCLRALREMGWAFSKSVEREKTIRAVWESRVAREAEVTRERSRRFAEFEKEQLHQAAVYHNVHHVQDSSQYLADKLHHAANINSYGRVGQHPQSLTLVSAAGQSRPHLPPLSVGFSYMDSAPSTAVTEDGNWSTYTPPTTSGSMTSTVATHRSSPSGSSGSPPPHLGTSGPFAHHLPPIQTSFKNDSDAFYSGVADLDPFTFSVDGTAATAGLTSPTLTSHSWSSTYPHQQNHMSPSGGYLDPSVVFAGPGAVLTADASSEDGCPHFGSDCHGFFH
ncbi:hypothetical protein SERLADRAFT_440847 [Serpula lacrymans var. lacrymans S7.9]|uniref:Transcription factor domain-containing protein n=1 Tax=Serpula lacrymans var. lacrymans (strain S7.9) TaxID=578457 RepID=F8P4Q8_SERL9|nr:uncharacterized protein SERLADRAFT_440847 [Serpula lacrymans var. lacrymans S7.9]EGO21595.1 hypothetical protein SERLADRAFT_440847 [Serpula lacrymans var. lacrymans S7.9]